MLPAVPTPPTPPPDDALTPGALRRAYRSAFVPRPGIYWADLLTSAGLGWLGFFTALRATAPLVAVAATAVAVLALYRSVLFIHELTHLKRGALPGFEAAWHLLVGFPLQVPSLVYVGSHGDHHRKRIYGTRDDPEYETFSDWSPLQLLLSTLGLAVVPAVLVVRWAVLAPLSWLLPPLRRLLVERLSTLVVNASYRRRPPLGRQRRRWWLGELGCVLTAWAGIAAYFEGALAPHVVALWYGVTTAILWLNQVRTLAAHRYRSRGLATDRVGELLDTVNLVHPVPLMTLLAPVGMRFHALHHFAPTLPYHSLGQVHRALEQRLPASSPYRRAQVRGIGTVLAELVATSDEGAPDTA